MPQATQKANSVGNGARQLNEPKPILALSKRGLAFSRPNGTTSWKREHFCIRAAEITTVPDWVAPISTFSQLVKRGKIVLIEREAEAGFAASRRIVSRTGALFQRPFPRSIDEMLLGSEFFFLKPPSGNSAAVGI